MRWAPQRPYDACSMVLPKLSVAALSRQLYMQNVQQAEGWA